VASVGEEEEEEEEEETRPAGGRGGRRRSGDDEGAACGGGASYPNPPRSRRWAAGLGGVLGLGCPAWFSFKKKIKH
jgi:hypothetical protein